MILNQSCLSANLRRMKNIQRRIRQSVRNYLASEPMKDRLISACLPYVDDGIIAIDQITKLCILSDDDELRIRFDMNIIDLEDTTKDPYKFQVMIKLINGEDMQLTCDKLTPVPDNIFDNQHYLGW